MIVSDELRESDLRERLRWLLRRRVRMRVTGDSMLPALQPGDDVLVDRCAFRHRPPQTGNIVVASHPFQRNLKIIKRIAAVNENGEIILRGDNPAESSDSRSFGAINNHRLVGLVTSRLRRRR